MKTKLLSLLLRPKAGSKLYMFINLCGLTIAITIAILIYGFVFQELNTDRFHKEGKNIYRVLTRKDKFSSYKATECGLFAPAIKNEVSGVDAFVRLWPMNLTVKMEQKQEAGFSKSCIFADSSFFSLFTFPLAKGVVTADSPRQWAVISEKSARQWFGTTDVVGKSLYLEAGWWSEMPSIYQIVGVMKDIPAWSTIQADVVLDYRAVEKLTDWNNNYGSLSYLKLNPKTSVEETEKRIRQVYAAHQEEFEGSIKLQSLQDVYYDEDHVQYSIHYLIPKGSLTLTRLLIGITLLILLLSSGNYIMIKIAQGVYHMNTFTVQRCFGAGNGVIWKRFFTETAFYFITAGLFSVLLASVCFPFFLNMISPQFHYPYPISVGSLTGFVLLLLIFVVFITSVLSYYFIKRIYINGIKNSIENKNKAFDIRKVLAVVSIAIFCLLSIDATLVNKQLNFLIHKEVGYNNQHTLVLRGSNEVMRNELLSHPDIVSVSLGGIPLPQTAPAFFTLSCTFEETGKMKNKAETICGDAHYLDTYQLHLIAGENFDPDTEPTCEGVVPVIVNQEFVKQAQLKQPVGTIFQGRSFPDEPYMPFKIIGVVEDFHYRLLYDHIAPLAIFYSKGSNTGGCLNNDETILRFQPGKRAAVGHFLNEKNYSYSDFQYANYYDKEKAFLRLINIAALLAILIGGLGIFAFSVFFTNSRKKEVALRKINGGTEWEIQKLFNRDFIRLTIGACVISVPLAYVIIRPYLEKFAYRVNIEWYFFLTAVLVCLIFVILVITWQIRKIVHINPVECLKEL